MIALAVASLRPAVAGAAARIVAPAADATIHDDGGTVHVVVEGVPPGDSVLPLLDGSPLRAYFATPEFDLHDVPRGTHDLYVEVPGLREFAVGRTPTVRFHVRQVSRLDPDRP